jgi:anti-sigma B factor antagonist
MSFLSVLTTGSLGPSEPAGPSGGIRVEDWSHLVGQLEPFAVEVQRRDDVAIIKPRGELDVATTDTLRAALDGIDDAGHLVVDLRELSFVDCGGLHLLVALHQRAQRDGFQLTLHAPPPPGDRAIRLCGLDHALPFAAPVEASDDRPGESGGRFPSEGRNRM